ncbi:MAG: DUF2007 domain-containing protein [Anaerolineae bacterium]|nr:DUF2007 domain-containing protein [Anaerolineae bacterium]
MSREIRSSESDQQPPRWVVILSTQNLIEAEIVAGRLKSEGIEAWVHQDPGARAYGITVGAWGEVRVLVDEHDYDAARRILDTPVPAELEADTNSTSYILPDDEADADDE